MTKEKKKKINQEKLIQFSLLENQLKQIQEQIQQIDQKINELQNIDFGLEEIRGKKDSQIMSLLGEGIFVKAQLKDDEKVLVNAGSGIFVKKTIEEAKEMLMKQILELEEIKEKLNRDINIIIEKLKKLQ